MTTPAGVIFDMDGTLLDSMFYWNQVPADCLRQIYGKEPKPDLMDRLKVMTLHQGCDWVRREYGLFRRRRRNPRRHQRSDEAVLHSARARQRRCAELAGTAA